MSGLPAATHIGGCGFTYGFGSTLRSGIEKNLPSNVVRSSRHILLELADHLVVHLLGELGVGDAEAALLGGRRAAPGAELEAAAGEVVDHRHALGDAGRVVHRRRDVDDPRADVDVLGAGEHPRHQHLVGRDVRVLLEEVVLGEPRVLPVVLVADLARRDLAHEAVVLGLVAIEPHRPWGTNPPANRPNSIAPPSRSNQRRRLDPSRLEHVLVLPSTPAGRRRRWGDGQPWIADAAGAHATLPSWV